MDARRRRKANSRGLIEMQVTKGIVVLGVAAWGLMTMVLGLPVPAAVAGGVFYFASMYLAVEHFIDRLRRRRAGLSVEPNGPLHALLLAGGALVAMGLLVLLHFTSGLPGWLQVTAVAVPWGAASVPSMKVMLRAERQAVRDAKIIWEDNLKRL